MLAMDNSEAKTVALTAKDTLIDTLSIKLAALDPQQRAGFYDLLKHYLNLALG